MFMWEGEGDTGALTNFSNQELTVGTPSTLELEGKRETERKVKEVERRERMFICIMMLSG